uniref:DH domain-containing protein n=1 Tax=Arcella intermedia TaxID=1963864 RepID=A0A6B2L3K6_9EUKA
MRTAFQKGQKIVAQDVIKKLFGNVETIHKFNLGILCKFKQRLSEYNGSFGDIFLDTIPQMDLYVSYINNYGLAIDTYKLSSSEKRFKTFCEEALQDIGGKLDLPAYLIMPVQRLPRYDLLLRELLKLTPENHVDYNNLVKAKDEIQKMNEFINDKQQEHENRLKLEQLQSKIVTSIPLVLTVPNRLFLREGKVNISKNNSSEVKGTLIAMNDILLLTKRDSTSIDRNIKKITSLILDVVPVIEQPKEEDEMILMDTVKFADKFTLRNEGGVQFTLCCGSDTWTITCENEKEQKNWIKALTEAIDTFSLNSTLDETMAQLNTDFNVIQARYGNLNRQAQVVDVTQILQKLVTEQGGSQLIIYPPAKKTLFGKLLSSSVKNKTLAIVYSLNGDVKIETYATDDTVKIGNLAQ